MKHLIWRGLSFIDGLWHAYVCPAIERLAPPDEDEYVPQTGKCPACDR